MRPATHFRGIGPVKASMVLAVFLLLAALLAGVAFAPVVPAPENAPGHGDLALYSQIIVRMQGGEGYYSAAHAELLAGGYGTLSVVNWRTPFLPFILSLLPNLVWAQVLLGAIAFAAAILACRMMLRRGNPIMALGIAPLLLLSLGAALLPGLVALSEVPAGVLILLSVTAYDLGFRRTGFAAGAAALFVRELAGLYLLVCLTLAIRDRRWREVVAWLAVLALYAGYYVFHYVQVQAQLGPLDGGYADSYFQFGGLEFLLQAASFNGLFFVMPAWVSAGILLIGSLGLLAWPKDERIGITVLGYLVVFAVAGKPFNLYWGAMFSPLLVLGLPWGVLALADLAQSLRASAKRSRLS